MGGMVGESLRRRGKRRARKGQGSGEWSVNRGRFLEARRTGSSSLLKWVAQVAVAGAAGSGEAIYCGSGGRWIGSPRVWFAYARSTGGENAVRARCGEPCPEVADADGAVCVSPCDALDGGGTLRLSMVGDRIRWEQE